MSDVRKNDGRDPAEVDTEVIASTDGRGARWDMPSKADGRPHLCMRTIERVAIIRFEGAEILFEEEALRAVREQLDRLIEEGHTRLVLNFEGVRYMSSNMLGILASLQRKNVPARGRFQLCCLHPVLRDMLRITHLDPVFDVYGDEAEALGLIVR
jgi:anti-sigma B factor antagonist